MVKVEHTRTHRVANINNGFSVNEASREILVTDAELVLIPPNLDWGREHTMHIDGKLIMPILISRTEKIEVGDWVLDTTFYSISTAANPRRSGDGFAKILALPEHFSPKQLQDIVDGKLKDGDKVLVEMDCGRTEQCVCESNNNCLLKVIKLNPHITIYPVEENMVPVIKQAWNEHHHTMMPVVDGGATKTTEAMSKTAMQKVISFAKGIQPNFDKAESYQHGFHDALELIITRLVSDLPEERQQIVDAHDRGVFNAKLQQTVLYTNGEQYYNETYHDKE